MGKLVFGALCLLSIVFPPLFLVVFGIVIYAFISPNEN